MFFRLLSHTFDFHQVRHDVVADEDSGARQADVFVVVGSEPAGVEVWACVGEEVGVELGTEAAEEGGQVEAFAGAQPCHDVFVVVFVSGECLGDKAEGVGEIGRKVVGVPAAAGSVVGVCSGAEADVGGVVPVG